MTKGEAGEECDNLMML